MQTMILMYCTKIFLQAVSEESHQMDGQADRWRDGRMDGWKETKTYSKVLPPLEGDNNHCLVLA